MVRDTVVGGWVSFFRDVCNEESRRDGAGLAGFRLAGGDHCWAVGDCISGDVNQVSAHPLEPPMALA